VRIAQQRIAGAFKHFAVRLDFVKGLHETVR